MVNKKNLIVVAALLVLLTVAPIMALADSDSGSARFVVSRTLFAAGSEIPVGQYEVKWESVGDDASVVFEPRGRRGDPIKVQGKIERVERNYDFNSISMGKDSAGRDTMRQLQFRGRNIRIVFE
jgi:hypothetical protein